MKKTLIASAIAAATLSTGAFAMDNTHADKILGMVEGMPKISGDIELFASYTDADGNTGSRSDGIQDDVDSTIAIDHETMISEETTAYAHVELVYNTAGNLDDTGSANASPALDVAYIGFKGGFGDVSIGTIDSVYESVDIIDFSENLGTVAGGDLLGANESQVINYTSPSIEDMLTVGVSVQTDEDQDNLGALVVNYAQDNLAVNFGYGINDVAEDVIGLSAAFSMDDLTLTAQFETQDEVADFYGILATYAMGVNTFNFGIMTMSPEVGEDATAISASVVHSLAENVYVYAEASFQSSDDDASEMDQYVVGTTYSF